LLDAYARCARIVRSQPGDYELNPDALALPEEQGLWSAYQAAVEVADGRLPGFIAALRQLEPAITHFFDEVLVMDEDTAVRHNRLALLQQIARLADGLADLSQLEGF
jgi:glycyl-tRNA synthetase beta subunit